MIKFMAYCPHPPIVVPEVGGTRRNEAGKTVLALESLGESLIDNERGIIDTIICITSHGPIFQDAVSIWRTPTLAGDLGMFGAEGVQMSFENDLDLGLDIIKEAGKEKITVAQLTNQLADHYKINLALDHGILVPLYFLPSLSKEKVKMVALSIGLLSNEELYNYGRAIAAAINQGGKKVGVIVSGDLSHRLKNEAPGGFHPRGQEFDEQFTFLLEKGEVVKLINLEPELIAVAGECGFRPMMIGLGILDKINFTTKVLSYEAPFGVGYLVAEFIIEENLAKGRYDQILAEKQLYMERVKRNESPPVRLARQTVEQLVQGGKVNTAPEIIPGLDEPRGAFVSLKKQGQLRGCIGTIQPTKENATFEIASSAVKAACQDPRFEPVTAAELEELEFSVDILDSPEAILSETDLDPAVYGVIVEAGSKSGLLLPKLPGVDFVSQQIAIAKEKAGIAPGEQVQLYRFKVTRYT